MADPVQPVTRSARKVPRDTFNAMVEAAKAHQAGRLGATGPGVRPVGGIPPAVGCLVKWSGSALPAFSVAGLGDSVLDPDDRPFTAGDTPIFEGSTPTADGPFAVLREPCPAAGTHYLRGVLVGVAEVDVDVSDAGHEFAAPAAGDTAKLASAVAGPARILHAPGGTGVGRCLVLLNGAAPDGTLMGKLDGTLSFGGSATMSIWSWSGSADADTGVNLTVYDWLLSSGQSIASGKQVIAAYVGGRWRVIGAQCA